MTAKRYKVLITEIDGTELDTNTEHDLSTSDMLIALRGLTKQPTTQATANSTLSLAALSDTVQVFTGTTAGQIVKLPQATTLVVGRIYEVWNFSNQTISIRDYGNNVLATLNANARTEIFLRDNSTSNGVWALSYTLDNGNVFGTQIYQVEDEAETSNTSGTTWATKLTLVTPSDLPLGDYLLNFQFIWRSSSANREADFRFRHNGTDIVAWQPSTARIQDRQLLSGFKRVEDISGVNTFDFQFKYANSSTTIYVLQARMFLWRVA